MLTLSDVLAARETIKDAVRVTPVFSSMQLGGRINGGVTLWLKAESLQKTGSFKPRGALNRVRNTPHAELERGIITVSAGNHAQGVAWAAREAGVPCTVVCAPTPATARSRQRAATAPRCCSSKARCRSCSPKPSGWRSNAGC